MRARPEALSELLPTALDLVRDRAGLVFTETRRPAFESALVACMHRSGAGDVAEYLELVASTPALFDELAAAVTVGESYFLRDPAQWDLLRTGLLPAQLARARGRPLRVWSAGCATGEEPYSAAMVLHQLGALDQASIVGSDLSRPALERARRAEYHEWALRNVPGDVEKEYFRRRGKRFDLVPWLRSRVEFLYLNLADERSSGAGQGFAEMDLILCRNVLIYFDGDTVARVVRRLLEALGEHGCLLLGASDPLIGDLAPCEVEVTSAGLVYRRAANRRLAAARPPPASLSPAPRAPAVSPPVRAATSAAGDRLAEVRRRYDAKDYAGAAALAGALRGDERSPELEILAVRSLANQGDLAAAGRACAEALDLHRTSAELVYLHAVLLGHAGRYAEATDALRHALYLDRSMAVAHLALGDALHRLGDLAGAKRAFRAVERLLAEVPPHAPIPASDGEPAARLVEAARTQLLLLDPPAA